MRIKTQLIVTALLLVTTFFLFEFTNLDIFIQDYFYDNVTNQWLLTHVKNSWMDIVFYSGIKIAIIIFGVTVLFLYIYSFKRSATLLKEYRKGLLVVWLSIVIVPVIIGSLKATTNTPCPCHIQHYGGNYPYIKVLDTMPSDIVKKFKCFPAGHASGGFALMSLFFLFKTRKNRFRALGSAMIIGWSMGIYKMLIGDHYLSHTLITMILAWLIILIIYTVSEYLNTKSLKTNKTKDL